MGTVHKLAAAAADTSPDRRIGQRRSVLLRGSMRLNGKDIPHPVTVKDISSTGLRVATAVSYFVGSRLEVELPNLGWVAGEVVRHADANTVGIRLGAIIDPDQTQTQVTGSYRPVQLPQGGLLRPL